MESKTATGRTTTAFSVAGLLATAGTYRKPSVALNAPRDLKHAVVTTRRRWSRPWQCAADPKPGYGSASSSSSSLPSGDSSPSKEARAARDTKAAKPVSTGKPRRPARGQGIRGRRPGTAPAPAGDGDGNEEVEDEEESAGGEAQRLGTASPAEPPVVNAAVMQAMADYFGDDGRELEEYLKRPRNEAGEVMLRALLIGSGPAEVAAATVLAASDRVCGLYYCPDAPAVCDVAMKSIANSSRVGAYDGAQAILDFCRWARVDVIFVGPDRAACGGAAAESLFAADGITLFPHDVSAAIADGSLTVADCFTALGEEFERLAAPSDQLVE